MTQLPAAPHMPPQWRRSHDGKLIAGVSAGLAAHLRIKVWILRVGFIAITLAGGAGVLVYALLWVLTPWAPTAVEAAGLETARRRGMRPGVTDIERPDSGVLVAIGILGLGGLWLFVSGNALPADLFWPMMIAGLGVVLVWIQVDGRVEPRKGDTLWSRLTRSGGAMSVIRLVGGLGLVGAGTSWILASQVGWAEVPGVLGASVVLLAGIILVAAPWLFQQRNRLRQADEDRVRMEARADMAAHLHDSVLQTLALIQRQSNDPVQVTQLARRQERELRTWLYGETARAASLRSALRAVASDIEEKFPVDVELVCVGDALVDDKTEALVLAAGEAIMNAAKHSGAPRIDVYAEAEEGKVEVFVRDRGRGFAPSLVSSDRMGVRQSIQARMERYGGTAVIRSEPGAGTEVKLEIG